MHPRISLTVAATRLKRSFLFGFFGRKQEAQAPSTEFHKEHRTSGGEKESFKEFMRTKEEEIFIKKRDELLAEFSKKRDKADLEIEQRKKDIEFAVTRSKREYEVTVGNLDYKKIILDNMQFETGSEFNSPDLVGKFIAQLVNSNTRPTEENMIKIVRGYLQYAEHFGPEELESREYAVFLDMIRQNIEFFIANESLVDLARFLDIFCVDYPEVWAKLEKSVMKRRTTLDINTIHSLLRHFSNQGEGSDYFYDQFEQILTPQLESMSAQMLIGTVQCYYNTRHGSEDFIEEIFKVVSSRLNDPEFDDIDLISKISLIAAEVKELEKYTSRLYDSMEVIFLAHKKPISLKQACLVAMGFGYGFGSKQLFDKVEAIVAENYSSLELHQLRMVFHGLVFTRRISKNLLKALRKKILGHRNSYSPVEMAKLLRAYHLMDVADQEIESMLHDNLLQSIQNHSNYINNEDLYEIFLTFMITRSGSRELYKTMEYLLNFRLPEIGKDRELAGKFYAAATKSGLVSSLTLLDMAKYV